MSTPCVVVRIFFLALLAVIALLGQKRLVAITLVIAVPRVSIARVEVDAFHVLVANILIPAVLPAQVAQLDIIL